MRRDAFLTRRCSGCRGFSPPSSPVLAASAKGAPRRFAVGIPGDHNILDLTSILAEVITVGEDPFLAFKGAGQSGMIRVLPTHAASRN